MDPLVDTPLQQLMSSIAHVLLGKEEEVRLCPELALEFQTMAEAQQQLDHALLSRRQRQH